jgi:hypothetical protein
VIDRERAQTHLLLLAERELRHALDPAAPSAVTLGASAVATVSAVAHSLVAVGVLDTAAGAAIVNDLALALDCRRPKSPASMRPFWPTRWKSGTPSAERLAPVRPLVVATGLTMPIPGGTLHVLAYVRTRYGARFIVAARSPASEPLDELTATDEAGTGYRLVFTGGGSSFGWTGVLIPDPDPPPDVRWLEITGPGTTARRVDLSAGPAPACSTAPVPQSPGEQLLNTMAANLLAGLRDYPAAERLAQPSLGQIVAGLRAAGALSPDSPVPGHLAALYESLGISGHGLTAPGGRALPEQWMSVLAQDRLTQSRFTQGQRPEQAPEPPRGCAGVAVTLPELDGIVLSLLGLHDADGASWLHVHASGAPSWQERMGPAAPLPRIWLRDSDNHWHVTSYTGGSSEEHGELTMRLAVIPPLARPDWIEAVVSGRSAEVRATVALRWG